MRINFNYLFILYIFLFESCSDIYSPMSPNFQKFDSTFAVYGEGALSMTGLLEYKTAINPLKHLCFQYNGQFSIYDNINNKYSYSEGVIRFVSSIDFILLLRF